VVVVVFGKFQQVGSGKKGEKRKGSEGEMGGWEYNWEKRGSKRAKGKKRRVNFKSKIIIRGG
jgi:hypothetical protein